MNTSPGLFIYTLHLADNVLILGQRNAEWCGHGPVLEQDIAITNISLDLIGQARNLYAYAARLYNALNEADKKEVRKYIPRLWETFNRELEEDDLAFLREERQFLNLLLVEQPKADWAYTLLRQFFFSAYQFYLYQALEKSGDEELSSIAEKSNKEVSYHLRWSAEWVIRLGDGTEESKMRIERAIADIWMFTGEMFQPAEFEKNGNTFTVDPTTLQQPWRKKVEDVFSEAGLTMPASGAWSQSGGKSGMHSEHLGFLLAEMQYLQRTFPNATW